MYGISWG